jgi:hypothetical protein
MRTNSINVIFAAVLMLVVYAASCAGQTAHDGQPTLAACAPGAGATALLLPPELLPAPQSLPRCASATYVIDPSAPVSWTPGESPADPFVMTAPSGAYRFAVYQAAPVNAVSQPEGLVLNLEGSAGTVWIGLSNYARDRWDWHKIDAPFSTWMEFAIPGDKTRYFDASDTFSFCLLAYDGDTLSFAGAHVNTSSNPLLDAGVWQLYSLTSGTQYGKHSAACLIDGKPALVYTRDDSKDVYVALADTPLPVDAGHWTSHGAATGGDWGGKLDIMQCSGMPCISYEDTVKQDVFFAVASSAAPASAADWTAHRPDINGQASLRLADLSGTPLLAYLSSSGLIFARPNVAGIPTLEAEWTKVTIDSGAFYDYPQLEVVDGGPVVAYQRKEGGFNSLMYAWSDSITDSLIEPGDSWTICLVDDANTNSGNNISLAVDEAGKAWISYTNIDVVHFMKLALANLNAPTAATHFGKSVVYAKDQAHTGQWQSMARIDGRPLITAIETGSASVEGMHAFYANRAPESIANEEAFDHELLDSAAGYFINEETTVFALSDGRPAVVYRTSEGLMFGYFAGVWL